MTEVNLAMLKLVYSDTSSDTDSCYDDEPKKPFFRRVFGSKKSNDPEIRLSSPSSPSNSNGSTNGLQGHSLPMAQHFPKPKSLQQYYGGSMNSERVAFMEKRTSLAEKDMMVSVEQVSIFLLQDGSVVSFFENSADDVEYGTLWS